MTKASQSSVTPSTEAVYRMLAEVIPAGVLIALPTGQHIYVNELAARMTGYSVDELMTGIWMVHPEDTKARSIFERALREGTEGSNYRTRLVRKDGSVFPASISWRPVRDERGGLTALCTFIADVSELQATADALKIADERYRVLAENSSEIFWEMDLEGIFRFVSPGVRTLGYEPEDWIGHRLLEFLPEDEKGIFLQRLAADIVDPGSRCYEVRALKKDGTSIWMEVLIDFVLQDGKPVRIQGAARDVTDRRQAEEEARRANELCRSLAENASDMIFEWLPDGTITYASPSVRKLGYTPEEMVGRHSYEFIAPNEMAQAFVPREKQFADFRPMSHEVNLVKKDGSTLTVEAQVDMLLKDGQPWRIHAIVRDITQRKQAEQALKESEQKYKGIVENSNDIIMLTRPDGYASYISPACRQILGYEPEELEGTEARVAHPDDLDKASASFLSAMRGEPGSNVQYRVVTKTGETRWISHSWTPVFREGALQTVVSVIRDVTERRHHEDALRDSEQKYKGIVENSSDLIMLGSPDGTITYASPACHNILDCEPEEVVGTTPWIVHPDDVGKALDAYARAHRGESGTDFEYRIYTKSGNMRWISHSWSPIFADGTLQTVVSVIRDVTEHKLSEEAIREAHAELEQAYRLQQEFINNVTHEVRTPLTAVKGYAAMLMEGLAGPVSEEQTELLKKVLTSSDHLLDVVNGVLRIARIKSGRATANPKACDPRLVVEKCVTSIVPQALQKGLEIDVEAGKCGATGMYDEERLVTVVTNLLTNAVKFTEEGTIEVLIECCPSATEIVVADPGMGIDDDSLPTIFDEFVQLDQPRKHKPAGFGIGLAIVAAMVETMGASLTVSSGKGLGTAFTLRLPVLQPPEPSETT